MRCEAVDPFIEAVAVGDPVPDEVAAHVGVVRSDAPPRLAMAQRIEMALASRAVAVPPADFTTAVIGRVRRDRWRAEQVVDFGFNVAVSLGVLLIVAGLAGLAWRAGVLPDRRRDEHAPGRRRPRGRRPRRGRRAARRVRGAAADDRSRLVVVGGRGCDRIGEEVPVPGASASAYRCQCQCIVPVPVPVPVPVQC